MITDLMVFIMVCATAYLLTYAILWLGDYFAEVL